MLKFQVTVKLESVEEDLSNTNNPPFVHVHEVKYIVTMFMKDCHCVLSVPGNGVPAFENDSGFPFLLIATLRVVISVRLRWRLHFDFLVGNAISKPSKIGNTSINKSFNCERIPWDYGITVFATNPFNVNLAYGQSSQNVTDTV